MAPIVSQSTAAVLNLNQGVSADHQHIIHDMSGSETHRPSIVPYGDDSEKLNASLELAWNKTLDPRVLVRATTYRNVHVMMLSWEKKFDDLKVQEEVDELKSVFEQIFHYHVIHQHINREDGKRTENQVKKIIADWVFDYDGTRTLLIVYFAGHGRPGKEGKGLEIAGHKSPSDMRADLYNVFWNKIESILHDISADALQIFDCCYAGAFGVRGDSGASEFLAACGDKGTTPRPGSQSFTRALIWALKTLEQTEHRFTTSTLRQKITEAPNFPKGQIPLLIQRDEFNPSTLIVLQPLQQDEQSPKVDANPLSPLTPAEHIPDVLTLKYVFETRPSEKDIHNLAEGLSDILLKYKLPVKHVLWHGIKKRDAKIRKIVHRAVHAFKHGRNSSKGHELAAQVKEAVQLVEHVREEVVEDKLNKKEVREEIEMKTKEKVMTRIDSALKSEFQDQCSSVRAKKREREH